MIPVDASERFHLTFKYRFEAAHRFTQSCEHSCMTPHGHTWFAEATFEAPGHQLDSQDMVMEFSRLKRGWKQFIQQTADHSFMHHYRDPILPALREFIPQFRGLPFPGDPTTELVAALFFAKLQTMHEALIAAETQAQNQMATSNILSLPQIAAIKIIETPTNSIQYTRRNGSALLDRLNMRYRGWWQIADIDARFIEER